MGRKSKEAAQRRHAKRKVEAAGPRVPAKKPRATAEKPEHQALRNIKTANRPQAPQHVAQPVPLDLKLGQRPTTARDVEALAWRCSCGKLNLPRRGLIADIPVLQCQCGRESEVEFDFSLANVSINDQLPITEDNVKAQIMNRCALATVTSGIEITLQMRNILSGLNIQPKETVISMTQLNKLYEKVRKFPGVQKDDKYDGGTVNVLASIAKIYGVISDKVEPSKLNRIPEYVKVKSSFYDIVRVLADGHPLTTSFIPGKNFTKLKPGQIYKAPREERLIPGEKSRTGHAILLIGAGRKGSTNYYHFINSHGKLFCMEEDGRYGYGMIRATDIRLQPVKFIRFSEDIAYHKRLASTDLSYVG